MSEYCCHCLSEMEEGAALCPVCNQQQNINAPVHFMAPGTVLRGRYIVGKAIGEGGFGITYVGKDQLLNIRVAIKEFFPNGYVNRNNTVAMSVYETSSEDGRNIFVNGKEKFLKEAQILARFSDEPGIVGVRDFFEENNTAYIIMEYLDGVDMKTYLKMNGKLSPEDTIKLLTPVMNSLNKVHAQGLIHRDISPDNIMLVGDRVKLLDFGAARTISAAANKSLSVMLKPGYAPEEQYRSKGEQGAWTDIYALCATMYKCITGITPDDATQRVYSDEVKVPSALNISIRPEIEKAIMKGMSVHQVDRYQCIDELIRGLNGDDDFLSGDSQTVHTERTVTTKSTEVQPNISAESNNKTAAVQNAAPPVMCYEEPSDGNNNQQNAFANQWNSSQPKKKGKKNILLISMVVLVIACIAALVIVLVNMFNDDDKDNKKKKSSSSDSIGIDSEDESDKDKSDKDEPDENNSDKNNTDVDNSDKTDSEEPDSEAVMSDDLFDFTFKLEGVVYKLPCKYKDFTDNGWTISSSGYSSDTMISGNDSEYFTMAKDGCRVSIIAYNMSGNAKPISECKIGGIECEDYYEADFVIAKGITTKSSVDDITAAFGTSGYYNSEDDYEVLEYYAYNDSDDNSVRFYVDAEGKYSSITITNFIQTEEDKTTTNVERPAYLDSYKAPTAMGSDFKSSVVKIEGDLYQLPCPVTAFIDNGWKIAQQSGDVVSGDYDSVCVERNGKELYLDIKNLAEYQTTVTNCAVYSVSVDDYEDVSMYVGPEAASVTVGMAKADLDAAITADVDVDDYSTSYVYSLYEYEYDEGRDFSITIRVNSEKSKVSSIRVSCNTWNY